MFYFVISIFLFVCKKGYYKFKSFFVWMLNILKFGRCELEVVKIGSVELIFV